MNALGIVLVHGYSGRPEAMAPLSDLLIERYGQDSVCTVNLPGHADGAVPAFDAVQFGNHIDQAVGSFQKKNRHIILLGHSTGGILALDHLQRTGAVPSLLILAATPAAIRASDLDRWEQHRSNRSAINLLNVARMVSWVNRVGAKRVEARFPVLILQGGSDPLVPPSHAEIWQHDRFAGPVRCAILPAAEHDLISGSGNEIALDCICRAVIDVGMESGQGERKTTLALQALDANVARFVSARPPSGRHLVRSPAALRALNMPIRFDPVVKTDPIQLNIEITSRCNLTCRHCARSLGKRLGKDMDLQTFKYLLDLMPNTFKVVLVGLGEPTLHPQLVDFVAEAAQRGHEVALVTNAMGLGKALSRSLIAAGLSSLTFSLDSVDPDMVSRVRPGSDIDRIIGHIRSFTQLAGKKIPTAVFTAVSMQTIRHLPALAAAVAGLGVKAWMLSDLNFQWNLPHTLWQNCTREHQQDIGSAIKTAFSRSLPVLSVRGIEELGLTRRYADFLLTAPASLQSRSKSHRWCLSPWQTLPVDVDGNVTICDCRPQAMLGNLLEEPFTGIWNGTAMQTHRRLMRSQTPPADCLACPRY